MAFIDKTAVNEAYKKLSDEQRQRFFPGKEDQAKKIIGSLCFLLGEALDYYRLLELYITVASRTMMGFTNERINITVKMRFSDLVSDDKAIAVIECNRRLYENFAFINNLNSIEVKEKIKAFDSASEDAFRRNEKRTEDAIHYPGFGVDPNNPIYAHSAMGSYSYLNLLYTADSIPLTWRRKLGIALDVESPDILDQYDLLLPNGNVYLSVYINMYARNASIYCPAGLHSEKLKDLSKTKPNQTLVTRDAQQAVDNNQKQTERINIAKQCPVCKMTLPDDSDFCQYCGSKIVSASTTSNEPSVAASATVNSDANIEKSQSQTEEKPKQPLVGKKEEMNGSAANKSEKTPETKTKEKSVWARIGVAVIILALIGLNVYQYLNAENETEERFQLVKTIETFEEEKAGLQSQISSLEQELESTKKDNTSLNSTITSLKSQITTLTNEKNSLQTRNTALANENANAKKAVDIYNAMKSYEPDYPSRDYFTSAGIVVVRVGGSASFDIWSTLNTTLYFQGSNNNADAKWGDWEYNKCPITVTGKTEGTTTFTFTNAQNSSQFKVLVVVIPW